MNYLKFLFIFLISLGTYSFFSPPLWAKTKDNRVKAEINWRTFQEVEERMEVDPKRIIVDVYTDWCKWCKVMDREIYNNYDAAQYLNENFYLIKLNAESKEPIKFNGRVFSFKPEIGMHELAEALMMGGRSFPATIIIEPNFMSVSPFAGYMELNDFEKLVKYFHHSVISEMTFEDWEKSFSPTWQKNSKKK